MRELFASALLLVVVGACNRATPPLHSTNSGLEKTNATTLDSPSGVASPGLAFAQANCAGCHAVVSGRISPNPAAPTFEDIVNTPGLGLPTLRAWLQKSHNYPEVMSFEIASDQIDHLAQYMITLQKSNYIPPQ